MINLIETVANLLKFERLFKGRVNEEAWFDNQLSNRLYKVTHQEKEEYIQIHEGYFVKATPRNWQEKVDEDYQKALLI